MISQRGLCFDSDLVSSDYCDVATAIHTGDMATCLDLYRGRFLHEFPYITDEFDDWRLSKAAAMHEELRLVRFRALEEFQHSEDYSQAAEAALRGLEIDGLDARLARSRVLALATAGDVTRAAHDLARFRRMHRDETGMVPEELNGELDGHITSLSRNVIKQELTLPIIGRREEIESIHDSWLRSRQARHTVLISGEAGIGKTRLLQYSLRRIAVSGGRIFSHDASEGTSSIPLETIIAILRDGFQERDTAALNQASLQGLSALIPDLLHNTDTLSTLPTPCPHNVMSEAVGSYFVRASQNAPVVIAIDNYQWVDESSKGLLAYLSKRLSQCPVMFIYCTRGRSNTVQTFEDDHRAITRVELKELTRESVSALVGAYGAKHSIQIPDDTAESLFHKMGGRPFFVLEALRQLRDGGLRSGSEWYMNLLHSPTLTGYVSDRLCRLSPAAGLLASSAAVINRPAPLELLAAVTGLVPGEAAVAATDLVASGVFRDSAEVQFAHDLVREAVANMVPAFEAAMWHARIANELLNRSGGLQEVASHYERAGFKADAYKYARAAAEQAAGMGAYREAEDQYRRMLRCASSIEQRNALYELARFYAKTGQYIKLDAYLPLLLDHTRQCPATDVQLACAVAQMEIDERRNGLSSVELARRAREILALAERVGTHVVAQVIWYVAEHFRRSKEYCLMDQIAAALIDRADTLSSKAAVEATAAAALLIASCQGYEASGGHANAAVAGAEHHKDPILLSRATFVRGTVRLWGGFLPNAREDYERAIAAAQDVGSSQLVLAAKANLSVVLVEQGDYASAIELATQCLADGGYRHRAFAFGNLALIHLRKRDYEGTRRYAEALRECHRVSPEPWITPHVAGLLGLVDLALGRTREALDKADTVTALLEQAESVSDVSHLHILRARAAHETGSKDAAVNILVLAAEQAEAKDFIAAGRLRLELARYLSTDNRRRLLVQIVHCAKQKGALLLADEASILVNDLI